MASAITKKMCAKCNKGAGIAMCHGCEQSFCTKHFIEHRQELSQKMDNIGQEHDVLSRDLTHEQGTHPLLARINQWEQESITKIQTIAKSARTDLQQLLAETKNNLKTSINKMTGELQSSRESDDYTELDIKKWTNQLEEFRKMLDNPTTVNIDYDSDARSVICLIKVSNQQSSDASHQATQLHELNNQIFDNLGISPNERFIATFGRVKLSEGGLIATCLDDPGCWSCASGINRYSSGTHYIHLRIEAVSEAWYSFFGIINSSEEMTKNIFASRSRHGWWDLNYSVVNGEELRETSTRTIQRGDGVTLMLDCDNRQIQLRHHRTNTTVKMSIDLGLCAFPWKTIIVLRDKSDCVRILH